MSRNANSASICKFESNPSTLNRVVLQVLSHNLTNSYKSLTIEPVFRSGLGATLENFMMFLKHLFVHFAFLIVLVK